MVRFVRFLCSGSGSLAPSRRLGSESDVEDGDGDVKDEDGDVKDEDEDGDVEDGDEDEDVELPIALLSHEVPTSCPNLCDRCLFYER
jgi:hypothetical protein